MNARHPSDVAGGLVGRVLGRMRFPQLFAVLAGLLLLDLLVPDPIPFIDELVLAVFTLLVGLWRERDSDPYAKPSMKNV
ncbi:MAG TPA: DUF6116 family protein, partial [Thermoanaerobaculia bacterium]|nr:DUF6116 family protein [Thermoanaerobaculia bacterium]